MDNLETLLYEERGGVAIVTMNRPDVYNAFNRVMERELRGGDAHELLPPPSPCERAQARHRPELHLVHGGDDVLSVHR